jgi:hypothetical protein
VQERFKSGQPVSGDLVIIPGCGRHTKDPEGPKLRAAILHLLEELHLPAAAGGSAATGDGGRSGDRLTAMASTGGPPGGDEASASVDGGWRPEAELGRKRQRHSGSNPGRVIVPEETLRRWLESRALKVEGNGSRPAGRDGFMPLTCSAPHCALPAADN